MRKPRNKFDQVKGEELRRKGYLLAEIAKELDSAVITCSKRLKGVEVVKFFKEAENKFTVYEFYDENDNCIYIGQSCSLYARLAQHKLKSPFYSEAVKVLCYILDSFPDMAFLEAQMIIQKQPKFTVHFIERIEFNMNGVRIN